MSRIEATPNENAITNLLFGDALRAGSAETTRRFLREVAGLEVEAIGRIRTQARWEDAGQHAGLVVGIAPVAGLSHRDERYTPGSIVDAAIVGEVAVVFELKIQGPLEHAQLVRHARHWALDLPPYDGAEPERPLSDGFALRTWRDVRGWLGRELDGDAHSAAERGRLERLVKAMRATGLGEPDASLPVSSQATPVEVDHPRPVPTRVIAAGVDLAALEAGCRRLYGRHGTHHVAGSDCRADAARMRQAFEDAGEPVPSGLDGNPMTPRRVLSVLYAQQGLRDAAPASWTELRDRLLPRGADRAVLLALLAWALANAETSASRNLISALQRLWTQTPSINPGFDELHGLLNDARE